MSERPDRTGSDVAVVVGAILALGFVMFGVALAGYWGGKQAGGSKTVTTVAAPPSTTTPSQTVDPMVAAGAHAFEQFACAQCHGFRGKGGVSPDVPALTGVSSFTVAQLSSIIDHGAGISTNPTKPYMPVWRGVVSKRQVAELIAYIRAGFPDVSGTEPPSVPQGQGDAVAGLVLYEKYGCINCHGPNGLGGVPNPASPDKTIPPLTGAGFRTEFPPAKIAEIIRTGSVLGRAPIVSMPHWGGILTDQQINQLIAYIGTLS
ncbi:MAG: c-type cytochrome [Gaiellales bacterium]